MSPSLFGKLPTGESVYAWTLQNASGASLQLINYGGIVTHLRVPDRKGVLADIVLGFDTLEPYLVRPHPYFGAIVGRVAGRISLGRFTLEGKDYELAINDPPNHLHGGPSGFESKIWHVEPVVRPDGADSVRLTVESPDGDQGYPGKINATVTVTLTADNEFHFVTELVADRTSPATVPNHSYFNLAGEGAAPITGHIVQVDADEFFPTDENLGFLGKRESVDGKACDLRSPHKLADVLPGIHKQHGDVYQIRRTEAEEGRLVPVARVEEPTSGRVMVVSSTEQCVQFYSGSCLEGTQTGKSGTVYGQHQGLCLECQGFPDAVNHPELGDILLRPGVPRRNQTIYRFFTI